MLLSLNGIRAGPLVSPDGKDHFDEPPEEQRDA